MSQNQRPLLLTGMFRSGTTLFAYMLNANKNINLVSDPFAPFFKSFRNYYAKKIFKKFDIKSPLNDYYFDKNQNHLYRTLQEKSFNTKVNSNELNNLKKQLINQNNVYYPKLVNYLRKLKGNTFKKILENFLEIIREISHKKTNIIGFKEVWVGEFTKHFLEVNRFSKVIYIVRDPRAVVASKLFAKDQYPLIFLVRQWRKLASICLFYKNKNKRVLIIKYENLVQNPVSTSKMVCKFLNVKYDSSMVKFSDLKNNEGKKWTQNSTFKKIKKFNKASISIWKSKLNKNIIKLVEFFCWKEMSSFGYKLKYKKMNNINLNFLINAKKKEHLAKWIVPYSKYDIKKEYLKEKKRNKILLSSLRVSKKLNSLFFLK